MPIPDPDKIWPKLEETGEEEVRKRLSMGVYADYKVPVIEEWLRRKNVEAEKAKEQESVKEATKADQIIKSLKNHPGISFVTAIAIIVIGIANFTDALNKLSKSLPSIEQEITLSSISGNTGWVFAGYFDIERQVFIEGPYVSVVSSTNRGLRRYVEVGDRIRLNVSRNLYVVDYGSSGELRRLVSPIEKGVIDKADETGLTLPVNYELIVRDVSEGHWPGSQNAALWLRVVDVPK